MQPCAWVVGTSSEAYLHACPVTASCLSMTAPWCFHAADITGAPCKAPFTLPEAVTTVPMISDSAKFAGLG